MVCLFSVTGCSPVLTHTWPPAVLTRLAFCFSSCFCEFAVRSLLSLFDLRPHSSSSLANSGNLPCVAWRAAYHYNRYDTLTTCCGSRKTRNQSIQAEINIFPVYIQYEYSAGSGALLAYFGLPCNHLSLLQQKQGTRKIMVRPVWDLTVL